MAYSGTIFPAYYLGAEFSSEFALTLYLGGRSILDSKMHTPPLEAASTMSAAVAAALELGHRPLVASWRKLSRRLWATACSECGREVWVSGPAGRWTYGGSATRDSCELDTFEEA